MIFLLRELTKILNQTFFDNRKTSLLVYNQLNECQLLILCLLSAESFYRVENNSFANDKDKDVFKTPDDRPLRTMTVEQLKSFYQLKSDKYWINNHGAFFNPDLILITIKAMILHGAKWTWATHLADLTYLVFTNFRIESFRDIIDKLFEQCSVNETIMNTYISYGTVVIYECYNEHNIEGIGTVKKCYPMLAKTEDIKYKPESQLKIVWDIE